MIEEKCLKEKMSLLPRIPKPTISPSNSRLTPWIVLTRPTKKRKKDKAIGWMKPEECRVLD